MKVVFQRVSNAEAIYNNETVASIGKGLVLYIGISKNEEPDAIDWIIEKIRELKEEDDQILCLSQFTLFATFKASKPSFHRAEASHVAEPFFTTLVERIRTSSDCLVERGPFGKVLEIKLAGSGMDTLLLEK